MPLTLLVDADVYIWKAASIVQDTVSWGGGVTTTTASEQDAMSSLDGRLRELKNQFQADKMILCLSDMKHNWRKDVLPSYKAQRPKAKPVVFYNLRAYAEDMYDCRSFKNLEGDDVMGLYATGETIKGDKIVVSIDKDMQQIPGKLYKPHKNELVDITVEQADRFHLLQALMGDATDGYAGCPGIGPKKAAAALDGSTDPWGTIVRLYNEKGLNAPHALRQARVARILRRGEYDKETGKVNLWDPSKIKTSTTSITPATPSS